MADPLPKFRVGRKNGRNVYFQTGAEPSDSDQQVGNLDTPDLAALFVVAVNADQDGFPPYCVFCMRPAIAHQGQLCSPEEPAPERTPPDDTTTCVCSEPHNAPEPTCPVHGFQYDLPGRQQLAATGSNDLRARLHDALTREHYRRARGRIEASPEDHCAAFTDVVLAELLKDPSDPRDRMAEAIRDANGTPEALAWWEQHPQLIPAHVYAAAALSVRWDTQAHLAARVGDAERRAEHAESEHQVTQDRLAETKRVIAAQPKPSAIEQLREQITEILDTSDETAVDAFLYFASAEVARIAAGEMTARWQAEDELLATKQRVRDLHPRDNSNPHGPWCPTCMSAWPCWTLAALDGGE